MTDQTDWWCKVKWRISLRCSADTWSSIENILDNKYTQQPVWETWQTLGIRLGNIRQQVHWANRLRCLTDTWNQIETHWMTNKLDDWFWIRLTTNWRASDQSERLDRDLKADWQCTEHHISLRSSAESSNKTDEIITTNQVCFLIIINL